RRRTFEHADARNALVCRAKAPARSADRCARARARPLVGAHRTALGAQGPRGVDALAFDLFRAAAANRDEKLARLAIETFHRGSNLRDVRGARADEQRVTLSTQRAARFEQRLEHGDELLGGTILQLDRLERLRPGRGCDERDAGKEP